MEVTGNCSLPSMNVVCHLAVKVEEEEATLDPTCMVGQVPPVGSLITTATIAGARGVLMGVSSGFLWVCSVSQGLLWLRGGGGIYWCYCYCCCCAAGQSLGRNRVAIIFLRTTISSLVSSASALDGLTDSTTTYSTIGTSVCYSLTNVCKVRPSKIVSVELSLAGTNKPTLTKWGTSSQASPIVSLKGKNPWCHTSM